MFTKRIYSPYIEWHGGECPVPRHTVVEVKFRSGNWSKRCLAGNCRWTHDGSDSDITCYCIITEQLDLEGAEKLLRENGYTVIPPTKPLTFEDVVPMTEVPPKGTEYWIVDATEREGVLCTRPLNDEFDRYRIKHRMAYLEKEHALIAARHHFGLKGGEL